MAEAWPPGLVPDKERKGLLDQIEELEAKRGKQQENSKKPGKPSDDLDLGKIR